MFYADTSVLVAALTIETATTRAQEWLAGHASGALHISEWTITEFSSALSVKQRRREIGEDEREKALAAFARLFVGQVEVLPVVGMHFRSAARLSDRHTDGLRAGDALHLAICMDAGVNMVTLDQRLARAASMIGVQTVTP